MSDTFHDLRKRIPFKVRDEDDSTALKVLDDQEQEELIHGLRRQNSTSNWYYILGADITLILSLLLHLSYFFNSSNASPLFAIAPSPTSGIFPLASLFTQINLLVHINLYGLLHPERVRSLLDEAQPYSLSLLSYSLCYAITCVPPSLCLFMGLTEWQTLGWWLFTPFVVYIVQSIHEATVAGDRNIAELEALRYSAPGA
ncbi:hypothetical protein PTI98_011150 [Pleurotus ostreatus]|uniref:Uncharacterized protein n=1 Tax=Pleurotus cornucopiae TaxID=5321 RepID=A0ACB7JAH8_PLECO|nr:hypothetical protein CCMSSC00406_0000766 [Pleurotus cornucopiae]KAJ8691593.1 hypothetical protein PTI98_011150 [Pleurotus ostreatus]